MLPVSIAAERQVSLVFVSIVSGSPTRQFILMIIPNTIEAIPKIIGSNLFFLLKNKTTAEKHGNENGKTTPTKKNSDGDWARRMGIAPSIIV